MAKPLIGTVSETQTFQNWLNKTNEMVGIFQTDAITASGVGDTTEGDATLIGDFTATNLIASTLLSSDDIAARTGGGTVNFQSPLQVTGSSAITATFLYGASGGQVRFTNGSLAWDVGLESSSPGNFIIDTGTAPTKFQLSTAGTLTVPNLSVIEDITADTIRVGTITADNIIGSSSDIGDTDDLPEGTSNLYFTNARARAAFTAGSNIDITNGLIDVENVLDITELRFNGAAGATTAAYIDGGITTGVPYGRLNITYGGSTDDILIWSPTSVTTAVNLTVTGDVRATGDVITKYSASDIALKENLQVIDNALDKVSQVNGYTFNYIDRPDERISGIVAQEIEKVLPEVVFDHERNNGTYKAVRYDNVIPLLLEAIKELKGKVDDLENRLNSNGN